MSDKEGKLPTFAQISDATVKVGAMQFGEILRLRSDLAAANAIIADQKQQLQRLHITGAAAGLVNANHTLIKERDQLREQLQELHAAGGAADEYRQLAADHKLAMVGIERLRVSYDAAVAENRKLQEICEKDRQDRSKLRCKLDWFEKQSPGSDKEIKQTFEYLRSFGGGYPDCYPEGASLADAVYAVCNKLTQQLKTAEYKVERDIRNCACGSIPSCSNRRARVDNSFHWHITCPKCGASVAAENQRDAIAVWNNNACARPREKLHALEAHGGHEQAPAEYALHDYLPCPRCERLPTIANNEAGWRATCSCHVEHGTGRVGVVDHWNYYVKRARMVQAQRGGSGFDHMETRPGSAIDANWPTVDGDGKPLERVSDGYHYAHGNGDVSALVGEPATPAPFLGPRECPKHGKWGCMCPREPEPKGPSVRRGTGRSPKVEM